MRLQVHDSIAEVEADAWNSIVGQNRLICRHEYLSAIEASRINDCRFSYPVLSENGSIVAHTCVCAIRTEMDTFAQGMTKQLVNWVRTVWPWFLCLQSVECGTPVALGNTISVRDGMSQEDAFRALASAVETVAADAGIGTVLFRDFDDSESAPGELLKELGYTMVDNLPTARMTIRWSRFEDYLAGMRSQYRCKLLAQKRRFNEAGCTIELLQDFGAHAPTLAGLWKNVYDQAREYRREVLTEAFFVNVSESLGERSLLFLARRGNEPIGFLLMLVDDETLCPLFCGLDYNENRGTGCYFNLFYEAVALAIDRKMREIDLGITTLEPKLDLGAVATRLHMYMKHRNRLCHRILPRMFRAMTPELTISRRHVFRT